MLMKMKNVINWFIFFFTLKDTIRTITSGRRKVSSDVLVMGKISKIFFPIMVMIGGGGYCGAGVKNISTREPNF